MHISMDEDDEPATAAAAAAAAAAALSTGNTAGAGAGAEGDGEDATSTPVPGPAAGGSLRAAGKQVSIGGVIPGATDSIDRFRSGVAGTGADGGGEGGAHKPIAKSKSKAVMFLVD
jgi:hypothetical protein